MSQNLYTYVGNNPINFVDPTGHDRVAANGWVVMHKVFDKFSVLGNSLEYLTYLYWTNTDDIEIMITSYEPETVLNEQEAFMRKCLYGHDNTLNELANSTVDYVIGNLSWVGLIYSSIMYLSDINNLFKELSQPAKLFEYELIRPGEYEYVIVRYYNEETKETEITTLVYGYEYVENDEGELVLSDVPTLYIFSATHKDGLFSRVTSQSERKQPQ